MDDYVVARCRSCGDALVSDDPNAPMIVCRSCGSVNQRSDAMAAFEQARNDLMAWMRTAIPLGVDVSATENIDPVARHSIFVNSIRPKIDADYRDYRFGFTNILSNPLIAMPFKTVGDITVKHDSKDLFGFDAKVKSVESLAVDEESKSLVARAGAVAQSYALMVNNVTLLGRPDSDRYGFMESNFGQSAAALEGFEEYSVAVKRFRGLQLISGGIFKIVNRDVAGAVVDLRQGRAILEEAFNAARGDIDSGSMMIPIKKELNYADSIVKIGEAAAAAPGLDPNRFLLVVGKVVDEMDSQASRLDSGWGVLVKRSERFMDVFSEIGRIIDSKTGRGTIRLLDTDGGVLVPFWHVEVTYSFVTGALMRKKSVHVTENLLLSASFLTTDPGDARSSITDIFSATQKAGLLDRIAGNETSISATAGVNALLGKLKNGNAPAVGVVVPVSTRQEAERQANDYINCVKEDFPQLKMGAASVKGLVYLPYESVSGEPAGSLKASGIDVSRLPVSLGDVGTMDGLAL